MEPLPQPDFQLLTQSLTTFVEQILLVPNIPTVGDGQTIAQQLRQITQLLNQHTQLLNQHTQLLNQQGEQITTMLNTITTLQAEVGTIKDSIANLDLRLDAR